MEDALPERMALEPLDSARKSLTQVLPPQADKILRALQHVELAIQYSTIDGRSKEVLTASRNALRALNLIEKRHELPAAVSVAVSRTISEIVKVVRKLEVQETPSVGDRMIESPFYSGRERRAVDLSLTEQGYFGPRRRSDDTIDGLVCLDEAIEEVG